MAIDDKEYGSIPSAAQSTSSVAQIKPGDSVTSIEKHDPEEDDNDSEDGTSLHPFITPTHKLTTSSSP